MGAAGLILLPPEVVAPFVPKGFTVRPWPVPQGPAYLIASAATCDREENSTKKGPYSWFEVAVTVSVDANWSPQSLNRYAFQTFFDGPDNWSRFIPSAEPAKIKHTDAKPVGGQGGRTWEIVTPNGTIVMHTLDSYPPPSSGPPPGRDSWVRYWYGNGPFSTAGWDWTYGYNLPTDPVPLVCTGSHVICKVLGPSAPMVTQSLYVSRASWNLTEKRFG